MTLANRISNRAALIALAIIHLAFFQLFLFVNTEPLFALYHHLISPSRAASSPSNLQGAQNVSLPHHR